MSATRPDPQLHLNGQFITLEPLSHEVLPELCAAIGHPIVFAAGYGGGPSAHPKTEQDFIIWAERHFRWQEGNPFAIRLVGGNHNGRVVGTTTLADFDAERETAHLGWTAYDPRVWGTAVNAETKLLMLTLAFDHGFGRVKIQADVRNERSRAAIASIGATYEGIARREQRRADGSWRDTAIFSVICDDWPRVRTGLLERLGNYGNNPVELHPMPQPMSSSATRVSS